jgi:hypothetical protein
MVVGGGRWRAAASDGVPFVSRERAFFFLHTRAHTKHCKRACCFVTKVDVLVPPSFLYFFAAAFSSSFAATRAL